MTQKSRSIPDDDLSRAVVVRGRGGPEQPSIAMVGDVYTVMISGDDTQGAYTLIDMRVPPGGGPGPHRHDFEELFIVQDGSVTFTVRGEDHIARAGQVVNIPANAPHFFRNTSDVPARMLCMCTPAGQDAYFLEIGVEVPNADAPPPEMSPDQMRQWQARAAELAATFATEILPS